MLAEALQYLDSPLCLSVSVSLSLSLFPALSLIRTKTFLFFPHKQFFLAQFVPLLLPFFRILPNYFFQFLINSNSSSLFDLQFKMMLKFAWSQSKFSISHIYLLLNLLIILSFSLGQCANHLLIHLHL